MRVNGAARSPREITGSGQDIQMIRPGHPDDQENKDIQRIRRIRTSR